MEPTDNAIHAGCLGNINATWTFHGRAGHSARPWLADNAIHRAAARRSPRSPTRAPEPHEFGGLRFYEVVVGDRISGRDRQQRDPGPRDRARQLPLRAGPRAAEAEAACASCASRRGELTIDGQRAVGRRCRVGNPLVRRLIAAGELPSRPSRPGRRWPSSRAAGVDA